MNQEQTALLTRLRELIAIDSPTGYTAAVTRFLAAELENLGFSVTLPRKGGAICCLGGEGNPLMLLAHVDTLGAMVANVKPDGRLRLSPIGFLNPNNVETENVRVITRDGKNYEGTIQLENPSTHVNLQVNAPRSFDENLEVVLDEAVYTADDAAALGISAGDIIALNPRFTVTGKGYIKSRFLDDKASAAVVLRLAELVSEGKLILKRKVYLYFTVQEELGTGASASIPPEVAEVLAVDMGCVGKGITCTERQVSICAKDSRGCYHYEMTTALIDLARERGIDFAVDVYPNYGSDAEAALRAGHDVRHALIGPGVYASHGYERTHLDGLEQTLRLLCAYLEQ